MNENIGLISLVRGIGGSTRRESSTPIGQSIHPREIVREYEDSSA